MSFVGIMFNKNGMVAFGDSRSTKKQLNGESPYVHNDTTKKVFKGNKILIVTCGVNEITTRNRQVVPLERIIQNILRDSPDLLPDEFVKEFQSHIYEYGVTYNLFIGTMIDDAFWNTRFPCAAEWIVSRNNIAFTNEMLNVGNLVNNSPLNVSFLGVKETWTLSEMEKRCRKLVEIVTELYDSFSDYNPVGGPVQIETLEN